MSLFGNLLGTCNPSSSLFSDQNPYFANSSPTNAQPAEQPQAKKRSKKAASAKQDAVTVIQTALVEENDHFQPQKVRKKSKKATMEIGKIVGSVERHAMHNKSQSSPVTELTETAELQSEIFRDSHNGTVSADEREGTSADQEEEMLKRTIFVGNIPAGTKKKALVQLFSQYGKIETVRLRSLPIDNDSKMPRRLQIKAGKVASVGIANAYIRFSSTSEAKAACAANMTVFSELHMRVDMAAPRVAESASVRYDPNKSVFVGNLPLDIQEEQLICKFNSGSEETQLANSVEAVRIVRDQRTRLGKGIAYVLFKTRVAALAALQLNGSDCLGRPIRVARVQKQTGQSQKQSSATPKPKRGGKAGDAKSAKFLGLRHDKAVKKKSQEGAKAVQRQKASPANGSTRSKKRPAVAARKASQRMADVKGAKKK